MIVYFANRKMEVLGQASTSLPSGIRIKEDTKTEDVETGVATFSCRIPFTRETEKIAEQYTEAGNYILRNNEDEHEIYTIIETETDTDNQDIYIYAEDAGLDLLNEVLKEYEADKEYLLKEYAETCLIDSGFEIGINECTEKKLKLSGRSEETATERLLYIAGQFECELSFSFSIKDMMVTHKYVNFYKQRGKDNGVQLRLNKEIDKITIKKTVANLATCYLCTGASQDGTDIPTTLDGYQYDDGDFYVSGHYLKSRNAVERWGRYAWSNEPNKLDGYEGHIVKMFTYDTVSQEELCKQAVASLKKACNAEVNYEAEITDLPNSIKIGDTVNVIDDMGELYLSARILKLEKSIVDYKNTVTLGDYLIKESGVSEKVEALSAQFAIEAKKRPFYTWIAYADNKFGSGISLNSDGKYYMGIAENQIVLEADISRPEIYKWTRIKGEEGRDINSTTWYYKLQPSTESTPLKPTEDMPTDWTTTEPTYTEGYTNTLYTTCKTTFSDDTFEYSDVSKSSSYEAAKTAYNKAVAANNTANDAKDTVDNMEIGGRNLLTGTSSEWSLVYTPVTGENIGIAINSFTLLDDTKVGDTFVLAFDIKLENFNSQSGYTWKTWLQGAVDGSWAATKPNIFTQSIQKRVWTSNGTYHCSGIATVINNIDKNFKIGLRTDYSDGNGSVYIKNLKIEKGNKATDWSPAPEDIDDKFLEMNSTIQLEKNSILASVSSTYATNAALGNEVENIEAMLELKINSADLVSELNASADVITFNSNRLVINSDNFKLTSSGDVTATSGTIGGFTIAADKLYNSTGGANNYVGLGKKDAAWAFWAGALDENSSATAPFRVAHNGTVYATKLTATGATLTNCTATNITANGATLSNCTFANGDDSQGLSMYYYDGTWKIRIAGTEGL